MLSALISRMGHDRFISFRLQGRSDSEDGEPAWAHMDRSGGDADADMDLVATLDRDRTALRRMGGAPICCAASALC